jgi:sulfate transport system ATP-binding protein
VSIEVQQVAKRFGGFRALQDVDLTVADGELVALLGPSGSGKTTLLRVIAGLEHPDAGRVLFDGADAGARSVQTRNVGFVFQHYALFRHMTVFENVAFGLRVRPRRSRPSGEEIGRRVHELLSLVQLDVLADRYPSQLSGGQRQRVALARALAVSPRVLLLDEPFGALDAKVRQELRRWLRRLHDELHVTSVFVTHDQEEALELADRVVIMNEGRIEQVGTPDEVYSRPATPFVYQFLGDVNLFRGRLEQGRLQIGDGATLGVRPHQLTIEAEPAGGDGFHARVVHINAAGPMVKVQLQAPWGDLVRVEMPQERYRSLALARQAEVFVRVKADTLYVAG